VNKKKQTNKLLGIFIYLKQTLLTNIQALFVVPVFLFVITGFVLSILTPGLYTRGNESLNPKASAAQNNTINFQARLLTNTGALVPDGNYHIEFKLYDSLAGGSSAQGVCSTNSSTDDCWWRETRTTGNLVAVKNGYISVSLGSVTPFGANIPWDQELWLTMNIGGNSGSASWNGEMSPRMRITSLPFAQAAAKLKGTNGLYDADQLVQLGPGSVQTISSTGAAVRINQTGTGALLQIQGAGSDKMTLAANGDISVAGTGVFQGSSVTIGTSSQAGVLTLSDGSTNSTTIQAASTTGNLTFTLPNAYGSNGDCLIGDGSGGLSFSNTCGGGSGGAPVGASYLTLSSDGTLTGERVLTAGTNISVSDGGANSTLTINVASSPTFSGTVTVQGSTLTIGTNSQAGSLVLNDGSNNTTTLQSAAIAGNLSFTLPSGYGSSGNCLVGDGAGGLSFSGTCGSGGSGTAPVGASYLTLGLDGTLTSERVLTAGSNISISDGGANGNLTVNVVSNPSFTGGATIRGLTVDTATATDDRLLLSVTTGGAGRFDGTITSADLTGARTYTLPDATGTFITTGNLSAITATGTIGSGTWQGSVIADTYINDTLTIGSGSTVDWTALNNYPAACGAGTAVTALGDTITCTAFAASSGSANYIQAQGTTPGTAQNTNFNIGTGTGIAAVFNATSSILFNGNNINTGGTLSNVAYKDQANSFSAANTFTAANAITLGTTGSNNGGVVFRSSGAGSSTITLQALTTLGATARTITLPDATGTVAVSASGALSLSATTGALTVADAVANGSTKGVASFTAADFNDASGNISIDYTNGQAASGSTKGFLTAADWTTFNGKLAAEADTLQSVTTRGATTTTASSFTGGATIRGLTVDTATATDDRLLLSVTTGGAGRFDGTITSADLTGARTYTLPDATGTFITTGNLSAITATGTIGSGTWQGSVIADTYINDTLTIGSGSTVDWTALNNYPAACGAGTAVTALGDTITCTAFAASSGSANYIQAQGTTPGTAQNTNFNIGTGTGIAAVFNATSSILFNGANINTGGTLSNVAYKDQANSFSAVNTFTAANAITLGTTGSNNGGVVFRSSGAGSSTITLQALTTLGATARTITLPDATGTVAVSASGALSLSATTGALTVADAVANGSTKGVASFTAADFNDASGNISIDYTNGQAASGSTKGFLTAADWTTFNGKLAAEADTLQSVTTRGATTTTASSFTGGATIRGLTVDTATATDDRLLLSVTTGGAGRFDGTITSADLTAARTYTLPNATGTFITTGNLSAITATGTIGSGTWQGSVIADTYINDTLTIGSGSTVDWTALNNYPAACGAGTAVTALGDTITCTAFAASSGSGNYIQAQGTTPGTAQNTNFNIGTGTGIAAVFNATSSILFNGANINTGGTLSNVAYKDQANSFSAVNTFTAANAITLGTTGSNNGGVVFRSSGAGSSTITLQALTTLGATARTITLPDATGTVAVSASGALSLSATTGALTVADAVANGSTKGVASFTAADFNDASGNISIDYTNGQAASGSTKGFLTAADWTTFNGKLAAEADTLQSVTTRGATTTTASTFSGGLTASGGLNATGAGTGLSVTNNATIGGTLGVTGATTLTGALTVNNTAYVRNLTTGTATATDDQLILSVTAGGAARFNGTITSTDLTANRTYTLPNETGTICTTGSVCSGYQASLGYTAANVSLSNLSSVNINTALNATAGNLALQTTTSGNITLTTAVSGGLVNILTGNLKVGSGTPGLTLNGDDAYISGTLEADGNVDLGGTLTLGADVVLSRGAANRLDLASGDSLNLVSGAIQQNTTTRLTSTGLFQAADGVVGGPAYSFSNSTNMGMYRIDSNNLGFSVAGTERFRVSNTGVAATGDLSSTGVISTTVGGAAGVGSQSVATNLYVQSRGMNLVTNGSGLLGNNYNFSGFTFDQSDVYTGKGSFRNATASANVQNDELIPVDISKTYQMNLFAKSTTYVSGNHSYFGIAQYDVDGNYISPHNHMYQANTTTTLASPLSPGDTTINLISAANWNNAAGASTHLRTVTVWGYTNSFGYTYPDNTYTRKVVLNAYSDGGINYGANTVTLSSPWPATWGVIPAGTTISNGSSGGTYKYIAASNVVVPNTWANYSGTIGGIDYTGTNRTYQFAPGTANIKLLFLMNRDVVGNVTNISNLSFTEVNGRNTNVINLQYDSSTVGLTIQGAGGQTADLLQIKNSSGVALSSFDSAGNLVVASTGTSSFAGNLKVGNGTPGVALNGEDAYIEGTLEVDGASNLAGDITAGSALSVAGATSLNGGATIRGLTVETATATQDQIVLQAAAVGAARFVGTITNADLTAARTYTLPDASGTLCTTATCLTSFSEADTLATVTSRGASTATASTFSGGLTASGGLNATGAGTGLSVTNNATIGGTLGVTGATTLTGALTVNNTAYVRNLTTGTATATDDQLILSVTAGGAARFNGTINTTDLTAARTYTLPNASGTFAVSASTPLTLNATTGNLTITDAAANGSTKGAASFATNDFDATSGNISIDYANGQAASGSAKGFLTSADWTTFNGKLSAEADTLQSVIARGATATSAATFNGGSTIRGLTVDNATAADDRILITSAALGSGTRFDGTITNANLTAARTYTLQDNSGIIPLATAANSLFFTTSGATSLTLPATGTVCTTATCLTSFSEADTLQSVTTRGATTTTASSFTGGATIRGLTVDTATATDDRLLLSVTTGGAGRFDGTITSADLTANRTYTLPDATGTFITTGNLSAITATGTIGSGTWQGSVIADTYINDTLTIGSGSTVDWTALNNYPAACGAGTAVTALGDTITCTAFAASSGSANYIQAQGTTPGTAQNTNFNIGTGTGIAAVFNATSSILFNGNNINTGGTLSNVAYKDQANSFSAANTFTAANAITLGTTGSNNGGVVFRSSGAGSSTITLQALTTLGATARTITLPDATGTVAVSASGALSLSATTGALTVADAVANGSTKGVASFTAADFNDASGNISIDYTNGQAASGSTKGFLTAADWTTFNGKLAAEADTLQSVTTRGATTTTASSFTGGATIRGLTVDNATANDDRILITSAALGSGTRFDGTITNANLTAARTYTLQDNSGIIPLATAANSLFFTTSGATSLTLPTTGTVCTTATCLTSFSEADTLQSVTTRGATTTTASSFTGGATIRGLTVDTATATDDLLVLSVTAGGAGRFTGTITSTDLTANRTYTLPNETGTICTTGSVCSGYQASLGYTAANVSLSNLSSVNINTALNATAGNLALQTTTSGNITLTTAVAGGLVNILTGNLKVGSGTPGLTLNGDDAYITGTLEADGNADFGGTLTLGADVVLSRGAANRLDLASGDSLNLVSGSVQQNATTRLTSTGLFQAADGAFGGPAYAFSSDLTTGMYRIGASQIGFSAGGTKRFEVTTTGAQVTGALTVTSGLTQGSVAGTGQFTNNGSTLNSALALGDLAAGAIGANTATVDIYTSFTIAPTAAGRNYTLPSPSVASAGRIIYISNIHATNSFTVTAGTAFTIAPGGTGSFVWNGSAWTLVGNVGGSGNFIQNQNAAAQSSSNFWISATGRADTSFVAPLYASTGTGSLTLNAAGANTMLLQTNATTRFTVDSAASTLTGNGATSILGGTTLNLGSTGANALTLATAGTTRFTVDAAASILTGNGATNIRGGTSLNIGSTGANDVTIGTNGTTRFTVNSAASTLTGNGATSLVGGSTLSVTSTGANNTTLDTGGAATVNIGTTNATAVSVGRTGQTTTVNGALTVTQATSLNSGLTVSGAGSLVVAKGTDFATTGTVNAASFTGSLIRYTGAGTMTLNGITGASDGRIITLINTTANNITINDQNASAAATERIITGIASAITLTQDKSISFQYDTTTQRWRVMNGGNDTTGVTAVGAISGTSTANGASITGNTINLAVADGTNGGVVSNGAQTFGGAKTFSALITGNAGITTSGGAVSLTGNAVSSLTTSAGALTLTSADAATWGTTTGNLNLNAGGPSNILLQTNGTTRFTVNNAASTLNGNGATSILGGTSLNLGSTGTNAVTLSTDGTTRFTVGYLSSTLTGNGATTITGGSTLALNSSGTNAVTLDTGGAASITIGGTNANAVSIGNSASSASILSNGSLNIGNNAVNKTINIGITGATANTTTINMATSTGAAQTVNIGSTNSTSTTNIYGGTGNINLLTNSASASVIVKGQTNSTTAFQVQTSGNVAFVTADSSNQTLILRDKTGSASIGSNLVTSQAFNNATYWTCTGWTTTATNATHNVGNTTGCATTGSNLSFSSYEYYEVKFTISGNSNPSNTITPSLGDWNYISYGANQTYTLVMYPTSTGSLTFTPTSNFNGTISNVSVKLISGSTSVLSVSDSGAIWNPIEVRVDGGVGFGYQTLVNNTTGGGNYAFGSSALNFNTSGNDNSAFGVNALAYNVTGSYNSAFGNYSLWYNSSGSYNVAMGGYSLSNNTIGNNNTAVGYQSLYSNTTGYDNTALGVKSLYSNISGSGNTASGYQSLYYNTTGYNNTAAGYESLRSNTTGIHNTASGFWSLYYNQTGSMNTAFGLNAGRGNGLTFSNFNNNSLYGYAAGMSLQTGGDNNILIGYQAGDAITTGASNILIGYNIDAQSATGSNQLSIGNVIFGGGGFGTGTTVGTGRIGIGGVQDGTDKLRVYGDVKVGTSGTNGCIKRFDGAALTGTCSSDERFKEEVTSMSGILNKVANLQAVTYKFNQLGKDYTGATGNEIQYGLIAQQVLQVAPELVSTDENGYLKLRYDLLPIYAIAAIGEQQTQITDAQDRLAALENSIQPASNNILDLTNGGTIQGNLNVVGNLNVTGPVTMSSLTVTDDVLIAGNLTVQNISVANITINGHIITAGNAPTTVVGTAAGVADTLNNIAAPVVNIEGNDTSGTITIVAGANTVDGELAKVTFTNPFGAKPRIVFSPANRDSAKVGAYYDSSLTTNNSFSIMADQAPQAGKTYTFTYWISQ
jgi:hypothetical protein